MTIVVHGIDSGSTQHPRQYRDVSPSEAASVELTWFFNEAETAMEAQSGLYARVAGCGVETLDEVERRIEARHSAGKIHDRLMRVSATDRLILSGLFLERYWSDAVEAALPGGLAGAAAMLPRIRAEHVRDLARAQTKARDVRAFIESAVRDGRAALGAEWRAELELACAIAVAGYERVRGSGPSVVPQEEG